LKASSTFKGRGGFSLIDFVSKHEISLDWLFRGDIKRLTVMKRRTLRY
jgi:hypothetical protein